MPESENEWDELATDEELQEIPGPVSPFPPGRPGYKKSTEEQVEEHIEFCVFMLSRHLRKGDMKRQFRKRYPTVTSHQMIEDYIRRARERLIEESGRHQQEYRASAIGFYTGIIAGEDRSATLRDKLQAQERLDKLTGSESPIKIEAKIEDGLSDDERAKRVAALLELARARRDEQAHPQLEAAVVDAESRPADDGGGIEGG